MANRRVTDLDPIATAPTNGVMHFVDTTDSTQNAAGSSFKVTKEDFLKENTAAILLNTAKVGYTEVLVSANVSVAANTAKTGITSGQSSAIIDNTAELVGTISKDGNLLLNSTLTNIFVNAGATSLVTSSGFITNLYTIGGSKKIKIKGQVRAGTTAQNYAFYNSTTLNPSTLISQFLGNGATQDLDLELTVPTGATIFIITKNPLVALIIPKVSLLIKDSINTLYSGLTDVLINISTINYVTTSFTGSVNKTFKDLQTKFPNGKFLICPSLKNGGYTNENNNEGVNMTYLTKNRINKFQQEYTDRILRCAELHSMATLDLYRVAGYDPLNPAQSAVFTANTTDKLHPNQAGHIRLADIMQNKIKDLFPQGTTGLKAIFIGDSITSNQAAHTPKVFYKYLAERLALRDDGMADSAYSTRNTIQYPKNAGVSGSGFSTFAPTNDPIVGRLSGYNSDYELIIVFAGVNDFYSSTLGVFGEVYL
jgi:hypothetical protein